MNYLWGFLAPSKSPPKGETCKAQPWLVGNSKKISEFSKVLSRDINADVVSMKFGFVMKRRSFPFREGEGG